MSTHTSSATRKRANEKNKNSAREKQWLLRWRKSEGGRAGLWRAWWQNGLSRPFCVVILLAHQSRARPPLFVVTQLYSPKPTPKQLLQVRLVVRRVLLLVLVNPLFSSNYHCLSTVPERKKEEEATKKAAEEKAAAAQRKLENEEQEAAKRSHEGGEEQALRKKQRVEDGRELLRKKSRIEYIAVPGGGQVHRAAFTVCEKKGGTNHFQSYKPNLRLYKSATGDVVAHDQLGLRPDISVVTAFGNLERRDKKLARTVPGLYGTLGSCALRSAALSLYFPCSSHFLFADGIEFPTTEQEQRKYVSRFPAFHALLVAH